jgi:catechol 2,3-dioxygenase-like lactoylglutathione lyase family enzyme
MTVQLDHTIVPAHDKRESANFLAAVLGLPAPVPASQFLAVEIDHGVNFDFCDVDGDIRPEHYAFRVDEAEFDAIFGRIRERGLPFWADPRRSRPGEIGVRGRGRGFYFTDPSGHFLEVLTRPDEQGVAA